MWECGVLHFLSDIGDISRAVCAVYRKDEFHVPVEYTYYVSDDIWRGVCAESTFTRFLPDFWQGRCGGEETVRGLMREIIVRKKIHSRIYLS